MSLHRSVRVAVHLSAAAAISGVSVLAAGAAPASATPSSFGAGDLVVYETLGTSSSSTAVSLVDYTTAGTPTGYAVNLPTADSGSTHALTESGSALNDGELTLSADGQSLLATGYDAVPGLAKITSYSPAPPRTVAIVSAAGSVDTATSLTDSTTEAQNFRSATSATTGGSIYTGGGGGAGVTTDGGTAVSFLNSDPVHDVLAVGGNLYESTTAGIFQVGSGLPTSGVQTSTALVNTTNGPAKLNPDQFALVTLGSGSGPDTLYVADGAGGAGTGGVNAVEKYSLVSGSWVAKGSVTVPLAVGLAVQVSGGVAHIYATGATASSASNNTVIYGITDSSGAAGTLSGTATTLATAPTGTDFKGLAFAPAAAPSNSLPESPLAVGLPLVGVAVLSVGYFLVRRRNLAV